MSEYLIPHPNVPTTDIGNAKLKESVMLFNENFLALDGQAQTNASNISTLDSSKAAADHNHDDVYSKLGHTHSMQEVDSLVANLEAKAPLVHTHDQYLTSMPTHTHDESEITNLPADLANKADATHTHTMSDVTGLESELALKATQTQLNAVELEIPFPSTEVPADVKVVASETEEESEARKGTSSNFARADHVHKLNTSAKLSDLKVDGAAQDGSAMLGTSENVARIDHSHPLNITDTVPSDCVKSSETSSTGGSLYYARADHVHKIPALASTDISYGESSTVGVKLGNHETRITTLEGSVGGAVKTVNSIDPDTNGNVALSSSNGGVLTISDINSSTGSYGVMGYDNRLNALKGEISVDDNNKATLPLDVIHDSNCTASCIAICEKGTFGHSNSSMKDASEKGYTDGDWPFLKAIASCFSIVTSGLKMLVTKLTAGSNNANMVVTTDASGDVAVSNPGNGLQVDSGSLSVKAKTSGGITVDSNGVSITALTASKWMKTDASGMPATTDDTPIVASTSSTGFIKNTKGTISYVDTNCANGLALLNSSSKLPIAQIPTGTTSSTVALGDHTHSQYITSAPVTSVNSKTGAVTLNADEVGALDSADIGSLVQAYNANLTTLASKLSSTGNVPTSSLTCDVSGHSGNCILIASGTTVTHSGNRMYTLVNAATTDSKSANKIITDKDIGNGLEADASTHNIKVKCADGGGITVDSNGVSITALTADTQTLKGMFVTKSNGDATYTLSYHPLKIDKYGRCIGLSDETETIFTNVYAEG